MRKLLAAAAMASVLVIAACNTVEGAGRDVESAGETVANTVK